MGTPIHMHLAKQMLKHFPLLLNDIYLSEEYYGENVLHMAHWLDLVTRVLLLRLLFYTKM